MVPKFLYPSGRCNISFGYPQQVHPFIVNQPGRKDLLTLRNTWSLCVCYMLRMNDWLYVTCALCTHPCTTIKILRRVIIHFFGLIKLNCFNNTLFVAFLKLIAKNNRNIEHHCRLLNKHTVPHNVPSGWFDSFEYLGVKRDISDFAKKNKIFATK